MFQLAVYGKGGIGKSTMSANISLALAEAGHRVMQIGCDPKHDSTRLLLGGEAQLTVLDYVRRVPLPSRKLEDIVRIGSGGVMCVESGGPEPGVGCAGRGILTSLETLSELGAPSSGADIRIYDVLGDVVCGGFAVPLREENSDAVIIVTSGEFMSLYAANNIIKGMGRFAPGKARLIGLVLNSRGVEGEVDIVRRFAEAVGTRVIAVVPRDRLFAEAEASGRTVMEMFPSSSAADAVRGIAERIEQVIAGAPMDLPFPLDDHQMTDLAAGRTIRDGADRIIDVASACNGCDAVSWSHTQKYSCASCGALMAFARLSDTAVVIHGPASCAYLMDSSYLSTVADLYSQDVYGRAMPDNIYSTRMTERSAIFGGSDDLSRTLGDAYSDGFREVVVVTTCVSGMIGDHCSAAVREFMEGHPGSRISVLEEDGVMAGDYNEGMADAIDAMIGMMDPGAEGDPRAVNIVGSTFFDLQIKDAVMEVERMLSVFGLHVNCRFLDETTMSSVRGFCSAAIDILANEGAASGILDRIRGRTGRDAPRVRIPTGIRGYLEWLDRMRSLFGFDEEAETEAESVRVEYDGFIERNRPLFEGRKVSLSRCISRDTDWFVDIMRDLGADVVRIGYLKLDEGGQMPSSYSAEAVHGYGKERVMEDWESLRPDLFVYDVDVPDRYPGVAVRMDRIGPGIRSVMRFVERAATSLRPREVCR